MLVLVEIYTLLFFFFFGLPFKEVGQSNIGQSSKLINRDIRIPCSLPGFVEGNFC